MSPQPLNRTPAPYISLGIFAWNEEHALGRMLQSLFQQSLFRELAQRAQRCEIICLANGCTDRTADVAAEFFQRQAREHLQSAIFEAKVAEIRQRGKVNAWNQFVHSISASSARVLFMMDADILLHQPDTLRNMLLTLESSPEANVVVDRPCKDLALKNHKSFRERLSLRAAQTTLAANGQLCAQLYGLRAEVARNIYLPRDLAACEDGFIKALVCTDFLTHAVWPQRIRTADNAAHIFEAYTSPAALMKNQKRQLIGQTIVHILIDQVLPSLSAEERCRLAEVLRARDRDDPLWLKRAIAAHLRRARFPWSLYPGLASQRLRRLRSLPLPQALSCLPSATVALGAELAASLLARRSLRRGCTDYWPKAARSIPPVSSRLSPLGEGLTFSANSNPPNSN